MYDCDYTFLNSDFKLSIRGVAKSDIGIYECQMNTNPVKVGYFFKIACFKGFAHILNVMSYFRCE